MYTMEIEIEDEREAPCKPSKLQLSRKFTLKYIFGKLFL